MTSHRRDLQEWYREAMLSRIDELLALRADLQAGRPGAADDLRRVAQALRGSGGTFGFPEISTAAGVAELTSDAQALQRMEGLVSELRRFVGGLRNERSRVFEWLAVAGGVEADEADELLADATGVEEAWQRVRSRTRSDDADLARRVAHYFGLKVADPSKRSRSARRLLPEAFMASWGCLPLGEDPETIELATDHPVSLALEVEARRLTGRRPVFAVAPPALIGASLASVLDAEAAEARSRTSSVDRAREETRPTERSALETDAQADAAEPSEDAAEPPEDAAEPPEDVVHRSEDAEDGEVAVSASSGHPVGHSPGSGPPRILVVDDESSARLLVRTLLAKRGYDAVEAMDGEEALSIVDEEGEFALAVVDLKMPRMDGLELIWELRERQRWSALPVIVVTGEQDRILETWIMEEGADDYVRKPIDPRLFLARVESTLRRTEARSAQGTAAAG